ncbi:MAG: hypothetical protein COV41_00690 [Candidatus Brennerbacteria bacterium CG11_big_fil_rev_8_21_14_0_20_43_10]|uniref:Ribulose-phosphate 3-epimerase n=3 Tax=Candidatus Brenneribacteriota TaxID=1817902 RepID=A0A2M8C162_9BACT|nr:MAG: hypothetical protein COX12_01785 [Candidatus Brennerbacteria bacterium CG23_combo_of_CG06-09_8_20_14_all_44_41]PIR26824.1 MAG: hypothetical protein COV41_00690 [Candidatus Brennerbacteria bacterium CG11_big_fil_rev_8_21_14_0_20_43_10]PIX29169.1 MAG: hypothetical protein COZ64_00910 [Candidatus Brennerbacteria bacterium CG_4_8_14_3_um_filter_43_14]PJA19164.1 MAG: hypothetical protein COX61_01860 [Candidatus Brennerbacteria bacterium CG_4_10_14_0_2_um_filter_43_14]PJB49860.1 MAG: hypothet
MIEVIPSVNRATWMEVDGAIHMIEGASDWVEIDVCDGTLSKHATWNIPADLKTLQANPKLHIAAHLMVKHPERFMQQWIRAGVRRIMVQWEGIRTTGLGFLFSGLQKRKIIRAMQETCKENWVEFGVFIARQTPAHAIQDILPFVDVVGILNVQIGKSGDAFDPRDLEKVQAFRARVNGLHYKIQWDGGVNMDTIMTLQQAGVDIAASTSFVFGASNPAQALEFLRRQAIGVHTY